MRAAADAGGCEVHFSGCRSGLGEKVGERFDLRARRDHQNIGGSRQGGDLDEILQSVVGQVCVDGVGVRGRFGDDRRSDRSARATTIFHDHRLAPELRELLRDDATDDVGTAARRERDHDVHRLVRIALRERLRRPRRRDRGKYFYDGFHWSSSIKIVTRVRRRRTRLRVLARGPRPAPAARAALRNPPRSCPCPSSIESGRG